MYRLFIKRLIDVIASFIGLVLLSPILLILACLIKFESKGPVLFKQKRLGKQGKEFLIFKFRTMVVGAENTGTGLFTDGNDPRITKTGRFLRKFSLDELPQFINILKGDMSLIGPRPPVPYHPYKFAEYPEEFKVRFLYRPGVTGLAQVNGRTNLTWTQRLELDKIYHEKFSFLLDLQIIFKTIWKIVRREDVYPEDINIGKKHLT